jgi:hypothetical protein
MIHEIFLHSRKRRKEIFDDTGLEHVQITVMAIIIVIILKIGKSNVFCNFIPPINIFSFGIDGLGCLEFPIQK